MAFNLVYRSPERKTAIRLKSRLTPTRSSDLGLGKLLADLSSEVRHSDARLPVASGYIECFPLLLFPNKKEGDDGSLAGDGHGDEPSIRAYRLRATSASALIRSTQRLSASIGA